MCSNLAREIARLTGSDEKVWGDRYHAILGLAAAGYTPPGRLAIWRTSHGGRAFVSEYGSAADPAELKALYAYSPYHNVKDGDRYPAVFLVTADHDNRVAPAPGRRFRPTHAPI